jgi:hypothetical protein
MTRHGWQSALHASFKCFGPTGMTDLYDHNIATLDIVVLVQITGFECHVIPTSETGLA